MSPSPGLPFSSSLYCYGAAAADSYADNATTFFHWGSIDANNDLLGPASYPTPSGHDQQLAPEDAKGWINPPLINVTRGWFTSGGQSDAEGPGLYVSNNPFDSSSYGPDLLIVDRAPQGASLDKIPIVDYNYRNTAVQAVQSGNDGGLPILNRYTQGWYVISRAPHDNDNMWLYVRPPRASDVQNLPKILFAGPSADSNAYNLCEALAVGNQGVTKSAAAAAVFSPLVAAAPAAVLDLKTEDLSANGLNFFRSIMSGQWDSATSAKLQAMLTHGLIYGSAVLQDSDWSTITGMYAQLSGDDQKGVQARFVAGMATVFQVTSGNNGFTSGGTPVAWVSEVPGILGLAPTVLPQLTAAQRAQIGDTVVANLKTANVYNNVCTSLWDALTTDLKSLNRTADIGASFLSACFGPTALNTSAGQLQYSALLQVLSDLGVAGMTDAQMTQTIGGLLTLDAGQYFAPQIAAAFAVYISAINDDTRRGALTTAFTAQLAANQQTIINYSNLALPQLYNSLPWVKLDAFAPGMQLLVKLVPTAKNDIVSQLQALSTSISDSVERANIDALVTSIQGGTP